MKKFTNISDYNGKLIPYNTLLDFTWWDRMCQETHLKCKIRKRKNGDIFDFVDEHGKTCFTHKLTSLNWTENDLLIIEK